MKIGCLIYAFGSGYEKLAQCARDSFAEFHPDVKTILITDKTINEYDVSKSFDDTYYGYHGIFRYAIALEIMKKNNYDKMIVLGADTITCARLEEFIDENDIDILATSDANYQAPFPYKPKNSDVYDIIYTPFNVELRDAEELSNVHPDDRATVARLQPPSTPSGHAIGEHINQKSVTFYNASVINTNDRIKDGSLKFPGYHTGRMNNEHINSDVTCFNGCAGLERVIKESLDYLNLVLDCWRYAARQDSLSSSLCPSFMRRALRRNPPPKPPQTAIVREVPLGKLEVVGQDGLPGFPIDFFGEQGALNIINILSKIPSTARTYIVDEENISDYLLEGSMIISDVKIKIIDGPNENLSYNIGNRISSAIEDLNAFIRIEHENLKQHKIFTEQQLKLIYTLNKEYFINTRKFSVKDGKLYSIDGKQIKVWHYCRGFANNKEIEEIINSYIFYGFNNETKKFFKQHCGCGNFFEKRLVI